MSKFRTLLFLASACVGAFLSVGYSFSVAVAPHLTQDSVTNLLLLEGWRENVALFVNDYLNKTTDEAVVREPPQKRDSLFYGKFKHIRGQLDYSYHQTYSKDRMLLQDGIIESMLDENAFAAGSDGVQNCTHPAQHWLVFTAGAMGAGKSHTVKLLKKKGRFPLHLFTAVDPDRIRHRLPEFETYVEHSPEQAGELTRKEAGLIAELLTEAALERGHNVLVDGSLRDADWYRRYFQLLRRTHTDLRLAILHVTAPRESVFQNALVSNNIFVGSIFCLVLWLFEELTADNLSIYLEPQIFRTVPKSPVASFPESFSS